jgi:integrase
VARGAESEHDAALITVAAYTGLRLGELRALRWGDIDWAGATIRVNRNHPCHGAEKAPKSGKVRSVPLLDQAAGPLDVLSRRERFTAPGDLVFADEAGEPLSPDHARDAFYAALDAAGLGHLRTKPEPIRFHDLRHTFGTIGAGIWPLHDLQAYMGHAAIQTTMVYAHHVPKTDAAAKASAAVAAMLGAEPNPAALVTEPERVAA